MIDDSDDAGPWRKLDLHDDDDVAWLEQWLELQARVAAARAWAEDIVRAQGGDAEQIAEAGDQVAQMRLAAHGASLLSLKRRSSH